MSAHRYHGSRPDPWLQPRAHRDPSQRHHTYGPIVPMDRPGLLRRMFGAN